MIMRTEFEKVRQQLGERGCTSFWLQESLKWTPRYVKNVLSSMKYHGLVICEKQVWKWTGPDH